MSNKGTSLPQACTGMPDVSGNTWGAPERFEYEFLEGAATDVQAFGGWREMAEDTLLRFEYRHRDEYDDGMGAGYAFVRLLVSEDAGVTSSRVAVGFELIPNNAADIYYSVVVEGLIRKGLYYKVEITPSLLTYDGSGQYVTTGDSIYTYSNATLTEES